MSVQALRQNANRFRSQDNPKAACAALRLLHRRTVLNPDEHFYLFRMLRKHGRAGLVDRYVRSLGRVSPTGKNWRVVALALWSEKQATDLLAWGKIHPGGSDAATRALLQLAAASARAGDMEKSNAIHAGLLRTVPDYLALLVSVIREKLAEGQSESALPLVEEVFSAAKELGCAVAEAEIDRMTRSLTGRTVGQFDALLPRLASIGGRSNKLEQLAATIKTRLEPGRTPARASSAARKVPIIVDGQSESRAPAQAERDFDKARPDPIRRPNQRDGAPSLTERDETADAIVRICSLLGSMTNSPRQRKKVETEFNALLASHAVADTEYPAFRTAELAAIVARAPYLGCLLANQYRQAAEPARVVELCLALPVESLDWHFWLEIADLAVAADDKAAAIAGCRRAAAAGLESGTSAASRWLSEHGLPEEAVAVWSAAETNGPLGWARLGTLRTMKATGAGPAEMHAEGLKALAQFWPFDLLRVREQTAIVSIARIVQATGRSSKAGLQDATNWLADKPLPNSALPHWVGAVVQAAAMDREGALARLNVALSVESPPSGLPLDIRHEIALLHLNDGYLAEAHDALVTSSAELVPTARSYYGKQLALIDKVTAVCGRPGLFPECLLETILNDVTAQPMAFDPVPGRLVTITTTLGQGGGERQAVNVIKAMTGVSEVTGQIVIIDSVEGEDGFFLPELQLLPVALHVVGSEAAEKPETVNDLPPHVRDRSRIADAIDLLRPLKIREDVIRFCRLLTETKPEIVHIRQDRIAAAIACAVLGVPRFFIHRGSLARDRWANAPGSEMYLRLIRNSYRQLMERTGFFLVNNSRAGLLSDVSWTGASDPSRFHTVYNAIDFDSLGSDKSPNHALRAQFGIGPDASVIGGVFRMDRVKRPLLWMEIAYQVLARLPNAHFLIVGQSGELTDMMRAYADAQGFASRLHMPGAMSDIGNWYRAMDCLLLTSEREGLPNVNIEAQHFGIPVVSSDVGGASETLEQDVTGFLVGVDAPADVYAERIAVALADGAWRANARLRAPVFVHERFKLRNTIETLLGLYGLKDRR